MSKVDIGADVRKRRKRVGLTQENIADIMNWSKATVSKIENNHRPLLAIEYLKLIELLSGVKKIANYTYQRRDGEKPAKLIKR